MKMNGLKKAFLVLLAVMTVLQLAACGETGETEETQTTEQTVETTTAYETDENGYIMDTIPEETNYKNKTASILCWVDDASMTMLPTEKGSDQLSANLYLRRLNVEERLGLIFEISNPTTLGGWTGMDAYVTAVENANNGDMAYDVVCSYSCTGPTMAIKGLLTDLNTLTYPDTEMPWWPSSVDEYEQYGSLFYISSSSSVQNLNAIMCLFCYSDMFTTRGITDPVDEVLAGTWTMETMLNDIKQIESTDAAGNVQYGLVVDDSSRLDMFYYGCGFHNILKGESGRAELASNSASAVDRISSLIDKMVPIFNADNVTVASNTTYAMMHKQTALMASGLYSVTRLEDLDYSPIPTPKLDSTQENYISVQTSGFDVWAVPRAAKDGEMSGIIIEAIASVDYREIAPLYYDINLKLRYSKGEAQSQMFDILRNSITYDFGRVNQVPLKSRCETNWRYCFVQKVTSGESVTYVTYAENRYATNLATSEENMETELAELLNSYRKYSTTN